MKRNVGLIFAGAAAALSVTAAAAKDDLPELANPIKFGDQAMNCTQLIEEVNAMEERLGGSPSASLMDSEQLAAAGTGLAQRAALSAGAGGAVGAIGQVGGLLGRASKAKKQREAEQKEIAEKRWIYMVGLYQGRNCDAQLSAAPAAQGDSAKTPEN